MDVSFNSQEELFFFDMAMAYKEKNILPNDFRKMLTSDWDLIKQISQTIQKKIESYKTKIEEKMKLDMEMKAEMQRRRKYG